MFTSTLFSVWDLSDDLQAGLEKIGWEFATQVQKETIPIALTEAWEEGKVKEGDTVVLAAFGSGFTWGSALIKW